MSIGVVTVQIVRDRVVKLNANGPDALVDYKGPGPQLLVAAVVELAKRLPVCGISALPNSLSRHTHIVTKWPLRSVGMCNLPVISALGAG